MVWLESGRWQRGDGGEHLYGFVRRWLWRSCGGSSAGACPVQKAAQAEALELFLTRYPSKMLPLILGNLLMRCCALVIIAAVFVAPAVHAQSGVSTLSNTVVELETCVLRRR